MAEINDLMMQSIGGTGALNDREMAFFSGPPPSRTLFKSYGITASPAIATTATNQATSQIIDGIAGQFVMPVYPVEIVWRGIIQFTANSGIAADTSVAVVSVISDANTNTALQSNALAITRTTFVSTSTGAKFILPFTASAFIDNVAANTLVTVLGRMYLQNAASTWTATPLNGTAAPSVIEARVA